MHALVFSCREPTDGNRWGLDDAAGNFSGLQGDLQFGKTDVAWANLFVIEKRIRIMDFTDW